MVRGILVAIQQNRTERKFGNLAKGGNQCTLHTSFPARNTVKGLFLGLAVGCALVLGAVPAAASGNGASAFLVAQNPAKAPSGFNGLCARYGWVCAATGKRGAVTTEHLSLAKTINRMVNRQIREIEDQRQYGKEEHWALPSARGGDCEDLVLLKKKMLVERGVPSATLLIATVLDRKLNSHAVLVLRTKSGDLVLDNLTNKIKPWKDTGYTFLKLQNPKSLNRWDAVLAGGVISDRPTASR